MGIYTVRCLASGQTWVGHTRTLDTLQNRLWFSLKLGGHHNVGLQRAFSLHGRDAFTFEALQQLPDEATAFPDALLPDMAEDWQEQLQAEAI